MRIPMNLSSEPFRRDRPILIGSSIFVGLLVALLGTLIFLILAERRQMRETRVAVDHFSVQLRDMTVEQAKLDAVLRQPANAEVLQRSLLLNTLLERKSISWARIFSDLEGVLPLDVRLIQVRLPQINSRNEVLLDMTIGAKEPGAAIQFFKHLEESPRFGAIEGRSSLPPSQNEPLFRYRITVNYAQKL